MSDAKRLQRGRVAVEEALIEAAADLLAEVGPKNMSLRAVATRAGVNHGQIHHYFGGKPGLIEAAVRRIVEQHARSVAERDEGRPVPPALSVGEDARYLRAIVRLVLDGEMELAAIEVDEGLSVPRRASRAILEARGVEEAPLELKATLAAAFALELGWAALEPFILLLADVTDDEADEVRELVKRIARNIGLEIGVAHPRP